tara:strand:- start:2070 stop:3215 length:1146 start_codon:yes stop_codon:yes gene_type:complete
MMLRYLLLFVSLCYFLPAQEVADIRLGSWNLEFLGADPKYRRDTPPRSDSDLVAIGMKIRALGVAMMGVQEICGEEPLKAVAEAAGPSWRAVLGTTGKWSDGKTQQGVGFLYDSSVLDLLYAEELLEFPSDFDGVSVFHRKPVTACFRHRQTRCDFRVVIVHLKAGRKARDLQKRKAEATHLRAWVGDLLKNPNEDRDIVIFGDFNSTYGEDPEMVLESGDIMRYLDQQQPAPTIMHFDTPIDQFCVSNGFREVQRNSLLSHHVPDAEERLRFRKTYSDHFPVTLRMTPLADDDPESTFKQGPSEQVLPTTRRPPSKTISTRTPTWPPRPGTIVQVRTRDAVATGKFIRLGSDDGWVVIDSKTGIMAFPREQVVSMRVPKN